MKKLLTSSLFIAVCLAVGSVASFVSVLPVFAQSSNVGTTRSEDTGLIVFRPPHPVTTMWGDDWKAQHPEYFEKMSPVSHFYFMELTFPDKKTRYELGLRSDGIVVWREIKR